MRIDGNVRISWSVDHMHMSAMDRTENISKSLAQDKNTVLTDVTSSL